MNIIEIDFNIDGVGKWMVCYHSAGANTGYYLSEAPEDAYLFPNLKTAEQFVEVIDAMKQFDDYVDSAGIATYDRNKLAIYVETMELLKLPSMLVYELGDLLVSFYNTIALAETKPPVLFVIHEVMLIPNKAIPY